MPNWWRPTNVRCRATPSTTSSSPFICRIVIATNWQPWWWIARLYTLATSTNENRWPKVKGLFKEVVESFTLLI